MSKPASQNREQKGINPYIIHKAEAPLGQVTALVSVMGIIDQGNDVIEKGSYVKTIVERAGKIRVLDNHNTFSVNDSLGQIKAMREMSREELPAELLADWPDATGALEVTIQFNLKTPEGKGAFDRIEAGDINEWSIGFVILDSGREFRKLPNGQKVNCRIIRQIKLYDVSPVLWGMNEATMTTDVKDEQGKTDSAKGIAEIPNYRETPGGYPECSTCAFYDAVNNAGGYCRKFSADVGSAMLCDNYKGGGAGKADPMNGAKGMMDGEAQRVVGDYLCGAIQSSLAGEMARMLQKGIMDFDEYAYLLEKGLGCTRDFRRQMSDDVALRPYEPMSSFFLWESPQGAEEAKAKLPLSLKEGRVISAANAAKLRSALDTITDVLRGAGYIDENEGSSAGTGADSEKGSNPSTLEELLSLQDELLALTEV